MSGVLFNAVPRLKSGSLSPRCVERQVVEVEKAWRCYWTFISAILFFLFPEKGFKTFSCPVSFCFSSATASSSDGWPPAGLSVPPLGVQVNRRLS